MCDKYLESTTVHAQSHASALINSLGENKLQEGESPLSAALTLTLYPKNCLRRMKTPFCLNLSR
jgi:hypothetical protein